MKSENDEAARAWDGVLFQKFCRFKHLLTDGLAVHGDVLHLRRPPERGWRVLDVGCGFGDLTQDLAGLVGPSGAAVGVDVARSFVDQAQRDAAEQATQNVEFRCADVQCDDLAGPYQAAYGRFGIMFFASPVAALRNIRRSLAPGAPAAFSVWRRREDNPWLYVAQTCVRRFIPAEAETADEPRCGPGPFSMQDADRVSEQLQAAGFGEVAFERHDADICIGRDLDEALAFALALGPAGEIVRLAAAGGEAQLPAIRAALREALGRYLTPRGVWAPSSTWIITARA